MSATISVTFPLLYMRSSLHRTPPHATARRYHARDCTAPPTPTCQVSLKGKEDPWSSRCESSSSSLLARLSYHWQYLPRSGHGLANRGGSSLLASRLPSASSPGTPR